MEEKKLNRDKIDHLILSEPNPFQDSIVRKPWHLVADVERINEEIFARIFSGIQKMIDGTSKEPQILVITGDAGQGKTHMFSRLFAKSGNYKFIYIPPPASLSNFYVHFFREFIRSVEQVKNEKESKYLQTLANSLLRDTARKIVSEDRHWKRILKGKFNLFKKRKEVLKILDCKGSNFLYEFDRKKIIEATMIHFTRKFSDLETSTLQALLSLPFDSTYLAAIKWLRCDTLSDEEMRILGVSRSIDDNEIALNALFSIGTLTDMPFCVGLDEMEIVYNYYRSEGTIKILDMIRNLFNRAQNLYIAIMCLTDVWNTQIVTLSKPFVDRIVDNRAFPLLGLNEQDTIHLVRQRMKTTIFDKFGVVPLYPTYPFKENALKEICELENNNPRGIIQNLYRIIETMKQNGRIIEITEIEAEEKKVHALSTIFKKELSIIGESWKENESTKRREVCCGNLSKFLDAFIQSEDYRVKHVVRITQGKELEGRECDIVLEILDNGKPKNIALLLSFTRQTMWREVDRLIHMKMNGTIHYGLIVREKLENGTVAYHKRIKKLLKHGYGEEIILDEGSEKILHTINLFLRKASSGDYEGITYNDALNFATTTYSQKIHFLTDLLERIMEKKRQNNQLAAKERRMKLERLTRSGECMIIEYKERLPNPKKVGKLMVAFSNKKGGSILFGISDDKSLKGVEDSQKLREHIAHIAREQVVPAIDPTIECMKVNNKEVIIVRVEEGKDKLYSTKSGRYLTRTGLTIKPLEPHEVKAIIKKIEGLD